MLKNILIAVSATYIVMLGFPLLVSAQENREVNQVREVTPSVVNSSDGETENTIEERVKKIKENASEQITENQQRRIEARCTTAQERINNLRTRLSDSIERRRDVFSNVSSRLSSLVEKLQAAGIDSNELNLAVAEMEVLLTTSRESVDNYMQNLADLTELDCVADPVGFKAILDDAREKRAAIISLQSEVIALKNETLKPALQAIRESFNSSLNNQESGE